MLVGVALYFLLSRGTGDDEFSAANESYRNQAYGQASVQFQQFINDYPDHPSVSSARVRIGLAQIWSAVERQRWEDALLAARTELPKIENEEAFDEARPELASLLPEIMEGFADTALKAETISGAEQLLALANQTLDEVNNAAYLPTSVRRGQQPRIEEVLAKLESVKRRIRRDQELEKIVAQIQEAAAQGQIAAAYQLRTALLKEYPRLELDERLAKAVLGVTETERASVRPLSEPPQPLVDDIPVPSQFRIALANRRGDRVASLEGQTIFVLARGSVYGLRADDGTLQWRRYVGFDASVAPLDLSPLGTPDVLIVDAARQELGAARGYHRPARLATALPRDALRASFGRGPNSRQLQYGSGRLRDGDRSCQWSRHRRCSDVGAGGDESGDRCPAATGPGRRGTFDALRVQPAGLELSRRDVFGACPRHRRGPAAGGRWRGLGGGESSARFLSAACAGSRPGELGPVPAARQPDAA